MLYCKPNENNVDRMIRIVLGFIIIGGSISAVVWSNLTIFWGLALGVIGLIPLATGILGWCPLYALFKFSTRETSCCNMDHKDGMPKAV